MEIRENIRLAPYTTLMVGGDARYFVDPTSDDDVIEAVRWARVRGLPVFVLGGGSNLLVSDAGFRGLVLHMSIDGIDARDHDGKRIFSAGAGVELDAFVALAVKDNCAGVECLSGIPGTVGGTPIQNVGAYGQDVSETIVRVCAVDATTLERVVFDKSACGFSYRQSRFNGSEAGRYIVTCVDYALQPDGPPKICYAELKRHFSTRPLGGATPATGDAAPSLSAVRDAVLAIRRAKGMVLDEEDADSRSAGSFFKNPVVSLAEYERIAFTSAVPVPHFAASPGDVKLAAAWLIEQAGIPRGFVLGPVAISSKHTLALVNRGGATAADMLRMKDFVQQQVRGRFAVELLPEPVMLGFGAHDPLL
jgi:UDP-N-acetylmuramate dehydrogenase